MFLFLTEQRFYDSSLKNLFLIKIIHFLASTKAKKKIYIGKERKCGKPKQEFLILIYKIFFLIFSHSEY
jgi:hypothetical protein